MITESLEVVEMAKQFDEIMQMIFRTLSTYTKLLNGSNSGFVSLMSL